MFKVTKEHTFWWPVKVRLPDAAKPGELKEETFKVRFKAMPQDRAKEVDAAAQESGIDVVERGISFIREVVIDWSDVVDDEQNQVPFSPDVLTDALLYPWVRDGILSAYTAAISGQAARRGN